MRLGIICIIHMLTMFRDVVWPETKMIKLLDSIYRNFYVPPILFAQVEKDGQSILRCVDGKQRLTSIQKFFDGHVRLFTMRPYHSGMLADKWPRSDPLCVDPFTTLVTRAEPVRAFADKTENSKAFWYTVSAASAGKKTEVPREWKEDFASKMITCSTFVLHVCAEYFGLSSKRTQSVTFHFLPAVNGTYSSVCNSVCH